MSMSPLVVRSAVVAALGGLLFGFDTAVISGTTTSLTEVFDLSSFELGFTVAIALIGTIVGALTAGRPADRYGRKPVLYTIGVLYFVSALGSALAGNWILFLFMRFIGGVGVGGASVVAPIYTAEIAPPSNRGRLVGLVQFNIVLGILLAYLSNMAIAAVLGEDGAAWRWMFGVEAIPAAIFVLLLMSTPESPRWLYTVDRVDQARTLLGRLAVDRDEAAVAEQEIEAGIAADAARTTTVPFFAREHRKIIMLAIAIATFNQLSGINAILYYAPDVFRMAGAGEQAALLNSVGIGTVNLIATMAALTVIDKFGRRKLMLVGSIGYLISLGGIALVFWLSDGDITGLTSAGVLIGLLAFIAAHAFGQGAVIWVFISEIFPTRLRARGQTLGSFTHWFFAAVVSWTFPWFADLLGPAMTFFVFFCCMAVQLWWVLRVMPETKGVPLEEMEAELGLVVGKAA